MIYLIDFENSAASGLVGLETLTSGDSILLFYSEMANKIPIELHLSLEHSPAKRDYFCVKTGYKNALDFQLSTYLGYLIASDIHSSYTIVSKDEGFGVLVGFWSERGVDVRRSVNLLPGEPLAQTPPQKTIKVAKANKTSKGKKAPVVIPSVSRPAIDGFSAQELEQLSQLLETYPHTVETTAQIIAREKTCQPVNVALVKAFGADTAFEIYRLIKPMVKKQERRHKKK